jgi:hypothetical protein
VEKIGMYAKIRRRKTNERRVRIKRRIVPEDE